MSAVVKRFVGTTPALVSEASNYTALPMTSAFMLPGVYYFDASGYDCTQPGLYRFQKNNQAPIYSRLVYGGDIYAFLSGVSWHHMHGTADEGMTGQTLANAGMAHKWRLRCGAISDLMLWLLPQYNLSVRKVQALTLQSYNGNDDGHIMFEVNLGTSQNQDWRMWDITNGCYFTNSNGQHLSLGGIISAGVANCNRVTIDCDEKFGTAVVAGVPNGEPWCMASYADMALHTESDINAWYSRIFQSWSVI